MIRRRLPGLIVRGALVLWLCIGCAGAASAALAIDLQLNAAAGTVSGTLAAATGDSSVQP